MEKVTMIETHVCLTREFYHSISTEARRNNSEIVKIIFGDILVPNNQVYKSCFGLYNFCIFMNALINYHYGINIVLNVYHENFHDDSTYYFVSLEDYEKIKKVLGEE